MLKISPQRAIFTLPLMIMLFFSSGCGSPTANVEAQYTPPFIPVTFAIDVNGTISIKGNLRIVTPVGTFG